MSMSLQPGGEGVDDNAAESREEAEVLTIREVERRAIREALRSSKGNRTQAAKLLGISRRTLIYRLKEYGGEA